MGPGRSTGLELATLDDAFEGDSASPPFDNAADFQTVATKFILLLDQKNTSEFPVIVKQI